MADLDVRGANCSNIGGATAATYQLGPGDVGRRADVVVTASNSAGSTSVTSSPSGVAAAAPRPSLTNVAHTNLPSGPVSSGTNAVTATATSSGPGVKTFQITNQQGNVVATYSASCAGTNSSACPASSTETLTVDYSKLPLGQDTLYLVAIDAAGKYSTAQSWNFTIVAPNSCTDNWTGYRATGYGRPPKTGPKEPFQETTTRRASPQERPSSCQAATTQSDASTRRERYRSPVERCRR